MFWANLIKKKNFSVLSPFQRFIPISVSVSAIRFQRFIPTRSNCYTLIFARVSFYHKYYDENKHPPIIAKFAWRHMPPCFVSPSSTKSFVNQFRFVLGIV